MKKLMLTAALLTIAGLSACERPTVVNNPAPVTVSVPGPPGPPGATGAQGMTGNTGNTGDTGEKGDPGKTRERTTVIVVPPQPAPAPVPPRK